MALFSGASAATAVLMCTSLALVALFLLSNAGPRTHVALGQFQLRGRELQGENQGLLEEEGVEALIVLTGNQHSESTQWIKSASGKYHKQRILHRPGWSKSTRCAGSSRENCEECSGSTDCWTSTAASRRVMSTGVGWYRFTSATHVRCHAPTITVNYEVQTLQGGQLRFFWDNVEVNPEAGFATHTLASPIAVGHFGNGSFVIDVDKVGGHTLEVEFVGPSVGGSAELSKLEFTVPDEYAQCEDFKACLDPLAMNQRTLELRSSNDLQLACLEAPTTEECVMWQYCLVESDRREAILDLLRAGGVGSITLPTADHRRLQETSTDAQPATIASTTMPASANSTQSQDEMPTCLNPLLEDADSWACDCYDGMKSRCEQLSSEPFYSKELCMRAMICEHPRVCAGWKAVACSAADPALQLLQDKLQQHRRLLERSLSTVAGTELLDFDRVLAPKNEC